MTEPMLAEKTAVARPTGSITATNADDFRQTLLGLVESGAVHITINLDQVDMIDSRGLSVFLACHKSLFDKGGKLTVVAANANLRQLFHVMRLDEYFAVVEKLS